MMKSSKQYYKILNKKNKIFLKKMIKFKKFKVSKIKKFK